MAKKVIAHKQRSDSDRRWRQAGAVVRKLRLLQILTGRGLWDKKTLAVELAETCGQSRPFTTKTIERDMRVLELAGVIIEEHGTNPKQYHVRPDAQFPLLDLTKDEILGQATATVITSASGLDVAAGAKPTSTKLGAKREAVEDMISDVAAVMDVLGLKLADHSQHKEILKAIQFALIEGKQIGGDYESPYQPRSVKLTLIPYRLCLAHQAWYLIARPVDEDRPKTYRVQRFKTLRRLDAPAIVPGDFSLQEYFGNAWGVFRGAESYDVEIEFTADAAPLVCETNWHKTQNVVRQHRDGGVTIGFKVDGLDEILWWVLGWSGRAKVLKPDLLRTMVVEQLDRALKMNGGPSRS